MCDDIAEKAGTAMKKPRNFAACQHNPERLPFVIALGTERLDLFIDLGDIFNEPVRGFYLNYSAFGVLPNIDQYSAPGHGHLGAFSYAPGGALTARAAPGRLLGANSGTTKSGV